MKIYKIRNKEGFFSKGGMWSGFSKNGKSFSSLGDVKKHLTMVQKSSHRLPSKYLEEKNHWFLKNQVYKDCKIVEYEIKEIKTMDVKDVMGWENELV